ncbi:hypothetical protein D9M69_731820 [compost metagenome]
MHRWILFQEDHHLAFEARRTYVGGFYVIHHLSGLIRQVGEVFCVRSDGLLGIGIAEGVNQT